MKFIFLTLIISFQVHSEVKLSNGNGVGNGGDAVVCAESIELLDFTEARLLKQQQFGSFKSTTDYKGIAKDRLGFLKRLDKNLGEQYLKVFESLDARIKIISKAKFRDVPDSLEVAIPQGCVLEQLAIQLEVEGKTVIHVSESLWDRMDAFNKAGLLLHEIIYEHLIATGETNSVKTRKLTALLFSKEVEIMDQKKFRGFLMQHKIKTY